jgi:murein tripeptide amidase MpaA
MQGFLDFITGNSSEAIDLRRKIVFKIIPMINPDGVIAGNYRTSLSGNDLNR